MENLHLSGTRELSKSDRKNKSYCNSGEKGSASVTSGTMSRERSPFSALDRNIVGHPLNAANRASAAILKAAKSLAGERGP